jgi:hypothetical protein
MAYSRIGLWFVQSSIVQGLLVALMTFILFAYGSLYFTPTPAMVIATGSAGTWLLVGYIIYIAMVVALAVTGLLYEYISGALRGTLSRAASYLAYVHLIFMNVGVAAASWLLVYAGYAGGVGLLPTSVGGLGLDQLQVHEQILGVFPGYIVAAVILALIGIVCGGVAYIMAMRTRK